MFKTSTRFQHRPLRDHLWSYTTNRGVWTLIITPLKYSRVWRRSPNFISLPQLFLRTRNTRMGREMPFTHSTMTRTHRMAWVSSSKCLAQTPFLKPPIPKMRCITWFQSHWSKEHLSMTKYHKIWLSKPTRPPRKSSEKWSNSEASKILMISPVATSLYIKSSEPQWVTPDTSAIKTQAWTTLNLLTLRRILKILKSILLM